MADHPISSLDPIELLKPLTPVERAALARQCRFRRYRTEEQITDHLGEGRDICFVVLGRVRVVNHSLSGKEVSFDDVPAGGFFGELSAIDGGRRSASVVAVADSLIAFLGPRAFQELLTRHPELAWQVMKRLAAVVRAATARIMDLSTLAANNRVQAELLRLAKPGMKGNSTAVIAPVPAHSDIAARVSTTRETVARVLSDLARDGIVKRRADTLVIRDVGALERMVEEVRGGA
ncbi:MAG TPA: Crp/Fnr family transcriptional regulator [Azospirillaceae bacterium]|nr:Crp/Fnr family transcriptional regulator [Azospirillaceae bacterium]